MCEHLQLTRILRFLSAANPDWKIAHSMQTDHWKLHARVQ